MKKIFIILIIGLVNYSILKSQTVFSDQKTISTLAESANSVYSCDLDGDGDNDVLSASINDNKIAWYENIDGTGNFGSQQIITTSAVSASVVYSCDINGDGKYDILSASDPKIDWYRNNSDGTFSEAQNIATEEYAFSDVYAVDLDGDMDNDVLSASFNGNTIKWYENTDSKGIFGPPQLISNITSKAVSVFACDIDNDGDNDVLSASEWDYKIAWYENIDGKGTFGNQNVISSEISYPESVYAIDIDGDGDKDVLSAHYIPNTIAWYENIDGKGNFGEPQIISTSAYCANDVYSIDLDLDGDNDVLASLFCVPKIVWYENLDGKGSFSNENVITILAHGPHSLHSSDIDGDGDYDVLSASSIDNKIAWYENQGTVNVQEINLSKTSFFPNPTNGIIKIDFVDDKTRQIIISDIIGKMLISKIVTKQEGTMDLSDLDNGIYIIKIYSDNEIFSSKIIKR